MKIYIIKDLVFSPVVVTEVATILISLYVAWGIGSNDVNFSSAISSRSIRIGRAVVIAAIAAFIGALFFGGGVSETLREDIIIGGLTVGHVFSIMLGVAVWSMIASYIGWPISSTVSIIGSMLGIALITGMSVNGNTLLVIFVSWIVSPVAGFLLAFASYKLFAKVVFNSIKSFGVRENLERLMSYLQIFLAFASILARSANDVAQAIFFFEASNPAFFHALGGFGISLGILTLGRRVMRSLGTKLIELSPSSGVAVQVSSTIVLAFFTAIGMPVSGSIVFVSAIAGAGKARRKNVNMGFAKEVLFSWILTIPASAIVSITIFSLLSVFA